MDGMKDSTMKKPKPRKAVPEQMEILNEVVTELSERVRKLEDALGAVLEQVPIDDSEKEIDQPDGKLSSQLFFLRTRIKAEIGVIGSIIERLEL